MSELLRNAWDGVDGRSDAAAGRGRRWVNGGLGEGLREGDGCDAGPASLVPTFDDVEACESAIFRARSSAS